MIINIMYYYTVCIHTKRGAIRRGIHDVQRRDGIYGIKAEAGDDTLWHAIAFIIL
jgi:ribosomal protein S3